MAFAVLDERVPGRALADDSTNPTMAVVQTREGLAISSRGASAAFVAAALDALRADSMVGLVWCENEDVPEPAPPAKRVERLDFAPLDPQAPNLAAARASLPAEVRVEALTPLLLERCEWRDIVLSACGSAEAFFRGATGLCLLAGDTIVAEAYAPYVGRGSAEVGVVTPESERGRGYATIAAAFLSAALAERSIAMYWSCDADNGPSIRVAEKLGFEQRRSFSILMYRPLT